MAEGCQENFIIYKITNQVNNKIYIGQTVKTLEQRKVGHINSARNGSNCIIHRAIRKYGADNFLFEILFYCLSKEEMNQKEIETIKMMFSKGLNGYNATEGGEGSFGRIISDETRKKMSISKIRNKNRVGSKATDETKAKLSAAKMGHKYWGSPTRTPEWRAMISAVNKGKQYRLGHKFTEEHREKIRVAGINRKHTEQSKAKMRASWIIRKQKKHNGGNLNDRQANFNNK